MEPLPWEARLFKLVLEALRDPASVQRTARLRGEYKVPFLPDPGLTGAEAILKLPRSVSAQDGG